jgi:hypothetical protein
VCAEATSKGTIKTRGHEEAFACQKHFDISALDVLSIKVQLKDLANFHMSEKS